MRVYETEEEQLEALALWWQQWRWVILATLSTAGLGILLYNLWTGHAAERTGRAYESFEEVRKIAEEVTAGLEAPAESEEEEPGPSREELQQQVLEALDQTDALLADYPGIGYSWLAVLQIAPLAQSLDQSDRAKTLLRQAKEATDSWWGGDALFNGLFRLHLARLLSAGEDKEEALELLDSPNLAPWPVLSEDLRGNILAQLGRMEDARKAWNLAKEASDDSFFIAVLDSKISSWSLLNAVPEKSEDQDTLTPEPDTTLQSEQ